MSIRFRSIWFTAVLIAAPMLAAAQGAGNKGQAPKQAPTPKAPTAAEQNRDDGRKALAAGDLAKAHRLLLQALWLDPLQPDLARDLALSSPDDDARALWAHAVADSGTDENGNLKSDAALTKLFMLAPHARKIAAARTEAAKELARLAGRLGAADSPSVARWAAEVGAELARRSPSLEEHTAGAFASGKAKTAPNPQSIVAALTAAIETAFSQGKPEIALVAARILNGLATQAGFKDLASPAPALGSAKATAVEGMARARAALTAREKEVPTIEQLEAMTPEQIAQFNAEHADPSNPGITYSPTKLYRLETTCGHETLLAAAHQVEYHHRRLVNYFGSDPFQGRQGIIRIYPEFSDLEAEGVPFWWAGGFQSGDITTVRFAHGSPGGLSPLLTHELTHRFDGALYPGIPAWAAEGRAVWTGGAFGDYEDERFISMFASGGAISETYRRGVTDEYLTKLIEGTIEEYRDNYTQGHALWVFLWSWEPDKQLFKGQLQKYLTGLRTNKGRGWFDECFADGKEGRPKGFKAFTEAFLEFTKGFWPESIQPWSRRYIQGVEATKHNETIYDKPTWHTARDRYNPSFGQDHATDAAWLLQRIGNLPGALSAFEWACDRDEIDLETGRALAELYTKLGKPESAWTARARLHRLRPELEPRPENPPMLVIGSAINRLRQLIDICAEASAAAAAAQHPKLAYELIGDANRVALAAGLETRPYPAAPALDPAQQAAGYPGCEPGFCAADGGMTESKLLGYDQYRAAGLWHVTTSGDVVMGRKQLAPQTGLQRESQYADTFTRTKNNYGGAYGLSTRVHMRTSYVAGAVIIGYQRYDRQFRFNFTMGDWGYATGRNHIDRPPETVNISFGDLREREGSLPNATHSQEVSFNGPSESFQLDVLVDGSWAHVFINGKFVGSHCAATGLPIEGSIGFASSSGVIAFETPTIVRHRLNLDADRCACRTWPEGLRFDRKQTGEWDALLGQRVRPMPLTPLGSVLLYFPDFDQLDLSIQNAATDVPVKSVTTFVAARKAEHLENMPLVVAISSATKDVAKQHIADLLAKVLGPNDKIVEHAEHTGHMEMLKGKDTNPIALVSPTLFFIDPTGIARVAEPWQRSALPRRMKTWLGVLRGW